MVIRGEAAPGGVWRDAAPEQIIDIRANLCQDCLPVEENFSPDTFPLPFPLPIPHCEVLSHMPMLPQHNSVGLYLF